MKKYSKEEIDGSRDYFRNHDFEEVQVTLGERKFSYFLMPQSLQPDLPDFVYRCTGELSDGYVFGISDSVDPRFRQYAVAHEFIEFTEIGIGTPNRCVKALDEEIRLVPDDIKSDYLRMRRDFFRNLITFCAARPEEYPESDLKEFGQTLAKLEELV